MGKKKKAKRAKRKRAPRPAPPPSEDVELPPAATPPPPTASQKEDDRRAAEALAKQARGERLTREQQRALTRVERRDEETMRWQYYRAIPQVHWRRMSGRQNRVLIDQAELYDLPFGGATIDLVEVVRKLHNFLAANSAVLSSGDALLGGPKTASLERLRKAQAVRVEMQNEASRRELLPSEEVHQCFSLVANTFRLACDELIKDYGEDAREVLQGAIDSAVQIVETMSRPEQTNGEAAD